MSKPCVFCNERCPICNNGFEDRPYCDPNTGVDVHFGECEDTWNKALDYLYPPPEPHFSPALLKRIRAAIKKTQ